MENTLAAAAAAISFFFFFFVRERDYLSSLSLSVCLSSSFAWQ
jgi:hypothetical protein